MKRFLLPFTARAKAEMVSEGTEYGQPVGQQSPVDGRIFFFLLLVVGVSGFPVCLAALLVVSSVELGGVGGVVGGCGGIVGGAVGGVVGGVLGGGRRCCWWCMTIGSETINAA